MSTGFFIRDLFYTTTTTQAISHRVLLKMKMVGNVLFYYIFLISIKHPSLGYNLHYLSLLAQESSSQKPGNARMTKLTEEQKESISAMASPSCMDSAERKRQYAAMGCAITKKPFGKVSAMFWHRKVGCWSNNCIAIANYASMVYLTYTNILCFKPNVVLNPSVGGQCWSNGWWTMARPTPSPLRRSMWSGRRSSVVTTMLQSLCWNHRL